MGPRESWLKSGSSAVADAELVALILGTGVTGRSALDVAEGLLGRFGGLWGLTRAETAELELEEGVGPIRAMRLHAALEAGRRSLLPKEVAPVIRTPRDAWRQFAAFMPARRDEELHALYLDRRRRLIARRELTRGSDGFTVVDPRQVFRVAVGLGAHAVILAHNHPSGDPTPSEQDREITRRVAAAGKLLGIALLDHLVIGTEGWASLAQEGLLPQWSQEISFTAESDIVG